MIPRAWRKARRGLLNVKTMHDNARNREKAESDVPSTALLCEVPSNQIEAIRTNPNLLKPKKSCIAKTSGVRPSPGAASRNHKMRRMPGRLVHSRVSWISWTEQPTDPRLSAPFRGNPCLLKVKKNPRVPYNRPPSSVGRLRKAKLRKATER